MKDPNITPEMQRQHDVCLEIHPRIQEKVEGLLGTNPRNRFIIMPPYVHRVNAQPTDNYIFRMRLRDGKDEGNFQIMFTEDQIEETLNKLTKNYIRNNMMWTVKQRTS